MDSAGNDEAPDGMNPQSECEIAAVGEKRPVENGETEELGVKSTKKAKCGVGEMRRVAEIVLVLSTMAGMRGGKSPTEAEVNLMEEARAKLVEICQDLAPKDLVARDAIGTVIEDLGLNWKLKDQRLGFRGTRLSIKEKIALTKKKMEESKKFAAPSGTYSAQTSQPSFGAMGDIRGPSHSIRMFPSDKPSNTSIPSGGLPTPATIGHVSAATSTPLASQPIPSEVRVSTASTGLSNSHPGRDSSALAGHRVEKSHFKSEGPNGTTYIPYAQANASANQPLLNVSTWPLQSHSMSSARATPENKVLNHNSARAEGPTDLDLSQAPQAARDQAFRPFIAQNTPANLPGVHQPVQGMKVVQPSSFFNNHNEIAKIVQKILQPKLPEHPTWTPPSREYMNKPLTCQMCKVTVNEVETVVLCDACEKGFHLKCLESVNQKGIPRGGEWHCLRCTTLSNGKPLPPKYGRVMRSITPPKGPSNPAGAQPSSEKKNGILDQKSTQEKLIANGSSGLQSAARSVTVIGNHAEPTSDSKVSNAREMTGNSFGSSMKDVNQATHATNFPNNLTKTLGVVSDSPSVGLSNEISTQLTQVSESHIQEEGSVSESKFEPPATLHENVSEKLENSRPSNILQDIDPTVSSNAEVPLKTSKDHSMVEDSESVRGLSACNPRFDVKQSDQDVTHANPVGSSEPNNDSRKHSGTSSDGVHSTEWIGNVLKISDGKTFYESCLVGGVKYKVQDHALFRSSHEKLIPSKLQAMFEDIETGSKWVVVNRCYFPSDLPEAVGHPCAPESNEVYESNHESSVMAGLIQGPCAVLPPTKFQENNERRSRLETEANTVLQPVFICKWFYDELKGSFQPVFG